MRQDAKQSAYAQNRSSKSVSTWSTVVMDWCKGVTVDTAVCRGTSKLLEAALASTAENSLSNAELGAAGTTGLLPPQYVDFKEQIRTEMFTIKQKMNELRASHGKATLTSFDDTNSSEVEIEVLTQDITRLFRKCEVRLQRFGDTSSVSEADEKVTSVDYCFMASTSLGAT